MLPSTLRGALALVLYLVVVHVVLDRLWAWSPWSVLALLLGAIAVNRWSAAHLARVRSR